MKTFQLELSNEQALAFAQFLKRARLDTFQALAGSEAEAQEMQSACEIVRRALAESGVAPR